MGDLRRIIGFCGCVPVDGRVAFEAQHFLNFLPLPQGQGSLRPILRFRFGWFTCWLPFLMLL
jgi:hypothetical protein